MNRELELIAGEYIEQPLEPNSRLWTLCQSAALNRTALQPGATAFVATHTLIDVRDGAKYIVQIVHSASMLLSMVLVYGTEQRLLCMTHLIGADSLPSKEQLDSNLVDCILNLSNLIPFYSNFCHIYRVLTNEFLSY